MNKNEILKYIDYKGTTVNFDSKRLIKLCEHAGLTIKLNDCSNRYKGFDYIIVKDEYHLKGEEWVPNLIENEDYEVSNYGRVRNIRTRRLMSSINDKGYPVAVTKKKNLIPVHRMVFFSFHPELIPNKNNISIDHINGVRTDNRIENLRGLTLIDNVKEKDKNQNTIKSLTTELIVKFGYEETKNKLQKLLKD